MKVAELRKKSVAEIKEQLILLLKEMFRLKVRSANQDETVKSHSLKKTRRDIARVKTILNEKSKKA